MTGDLVPEEQARRNGALYFAAHSLEAMLPALKAYLLQAKPR